MPCGMSVREVGGEGISKLAFWIWWVFYFPEWHATCQEILLSPLLSHLREQFSFSYFPSHTMLKTVILNRVISNFSGNLNKMICNNCLLATNSSEIYLNLQIFCLFVFLFTNINSSFICNKRKLERAQMSSNK